MTINLTPEQRRFIEERLETGDYSDESEVVGHALNLWQRYRERVEEIRAGVQRGIDDIEAGRYRTISNPEEAKAFGDEIKKRGRERRAEREKTTQ